MLVPSSAFVTQVLWHTFEPARFCLAGDDKAVELWDVRGNHITFQSLFGFLV